MAGAPKLKVYDPQGVYVAACKYGEDAACLAALYGHGATIRDGHNYQNCVWKEGYEDFSAGESYYRVAGIILDRMNAKAEAAAARWRERYPAEGSK